MMKLNLIQHDYTSQYGDRAGIIITFTLSSRRVMDSKSRGFWFKAFLTRDWFVSLVKTL